MFNDYLFNYEYFLFYNINDKMRYDDKVFTPGKKECAGMGFCFIVSSN